MSSTREAQSLEKLLDPVWLSSALESTVKDVKVIVPTRILEQSDVTVVEAQQQGEGGGGSSSTTTTSLTLLFKYVSVKKLQARMHKTEEKWCISVKSFENEWAFHGVVNHGEGHRQVR